MVNRLADSSTRVQQNVASKIENNVNATTNENVTAVKEKQPVYENEASLKEALSPNIAEKMTESLNNFLETTSTKLRYEYHDKLGKYYVTLVDKQTDEVVQEIPNKKLMDMHAAMLDFVGVLIDKKM
jgi:flagellar protein FlaG